MMAPFIGFAFYLLLAISLGGRGPRPRPHAQASPVESESSLTCREYCAHDLARSTADSLVKRQLGLGTQIEDERPRPSPSSESPPYGNTTVTTSSTISDKASVKSSYEIAAEQPSSTLKPVHPKVSCPVLLKFNPCYSSMMSDLTLAHPGLAAGDDEKTTTATVTATSHHEMTTTTTATATSHHEMTDTETVTVTPHQPTSTTPAAPALASSSSPSSGAPVAAIAIPVALVALAALLIVPCVIRRFAPRLWARLNSCLPLEDVYAGVAATWARLRLTRQRNREVRARASAGTAAAATAVGPILTGDGRGSGSGGRWAEKQMGGDGEGGDEGKRVGVLGRWRRRQEEKLRVVDARWAREERWGLRGAHGHASAAGGMVGSGSMRSFEDVRRDELRRAKKEKGAVGS